MSLDRLFSSIPDPRTYSVPEYSLPRGEPVFPVAITNEELSRLHDLHEDFSAVDPTGIDSNPFLAATDEFVRRTFGTTLERPDERLNDDVATMLADFSSDLGDRTIDVVDATPAHHRTLYAFLASCGGYHLAPHVRFDPEEEAVETLYDVYERVTEQDVYLKHPSRFFE